MVSLEVYRLYIDSRGCVSGDASEFEYQLGMDVTAVQEPIAIMDTVLIPASWHVVEEGVNDRISATEQTLVE